jgi:hypothetical protein
MILRPGRILSYVASLLAVGLALAASPTPAQAASGLVVDYLGKCRGNFKTIQDAVAFAAGQPNWATAQVKTITVCMGLYQGPIVINGGANVKLIAKKGAIITTDGTNPYSQSIISVTNSTNVTVQGFIIDGRGLVDFVSDNAAISFSESSGSITKNTIAHWHSSFFPTYRAGVGIQAGGSTGQTVKITKNVMLDVDETGIIATGTITALITGNKVTSTTTDASSGGTGSGSGMARPAW